MKLSDYVIDFFAKKGVKDFFVMTGGAAAHLINSVGEHPDCEYLCFNHEQAAAMAADAYRRVKSVPAVTIATSGPGAINLFTGIACSYYDSIPTIHLTGNVSSFRSSNGSKLRQLGFQESRVVEMAQYITKGSYYVSNGNEIRKILEEAWEVAHAGRPGPVLIDIPDDIQRLEIEPHTLDQYNGTQQSSASEDFSFVNATEYDIFDHLQDAKRPVLVLGAGINGTSTKRRLAETLVEHWRIPTLLTWATLDLLPTDHPFNAGNFGTHGTRHGNFAVQNADLVISIGSRLDTHATGSPVKNFARAAKRIIFDVDVAELQKFKEYNLENTDLYCADTQEVLTRFLALPEPDINIPEWWEKIDGWKAKYPTYKVTENDPEFVNPFRLMERLSSFSDENTIFVVDSSSSLPQAFHGLKLKRGQRIFSAFNNSPMGYALPAAIGAWKATGKKVIAIQGDGAMQINIQELSVIKKHNMNITLVVLNNKGYNMIKETQNQWLNSKYHAADETLGIAVPKFTAVAEAYGFQTQYLSNNDNIRGVLNANQPMVIEANLNPEKTEFPITLYGKAIEDMSPYLDKDELKENMIIPLLEEKI